MNKAKLSAIITINGDKSRFENCIDTVLNQTLKEIEIIYINSSDKFLNSYKEKNTIKFAKTINEAIKISEGEYIGFINSDDYIDLNYFEELYNNAIKQNADISATSSVYMQSGNKQKNVGPKGSHTAETIINKGEIIKADCDYQNKIYKRVFLNNNNIEFLNENYFGNENYFTIKAVLAANKVVFTNNVSYYTLSEKLSGAKNINSLAKVYKILLKEFKGRENEIKIIKERLPENSKQLYSKLPSIKRKFFMKHIKSEFPDIEINLGKTKPPFLKRIFSVENTYSKLKRTKIFRIFGIKIAQKIKASKKDKIEYANYVINAQKDRSNFVKITKESYKRKENDPKLIAFYLPQFHNFPENEKWFGRGFSEWTNVTKAVPQYVGHYQPHLPIDLGFYNLETTDAMKRQIELAKMYGIYGFSFYYYWFSGHKVMEKPIEMFLADKSLDMPFFMFWANEPWTKLWGDGEQDEVLFDHEIKEGDDVKFMNDILPYMKDERYIKINNKPLLIIYKPEIYLSGVMAEFMQKIRNIAKNEGFDDLFIMLVKKEENLEELVTSNKFDAVVEFIPAGFTSGKDFIFKDEKLVNDNFRGAVFDVDDYVTNKKYFYKTNHKTFKGLFPMWDNTARKVESGAFIFQSTSKLYKTWLKDIINWTKENNKKDEQYIFINAWNEWAEGAHLEPDQKYGYAYLQATKEALEEARK